MQGEDLQTDENRNQRAQKVVSNLGVKLHRFEPSGRELWTVVGSNVDFIVFSANRTGKEAGAPELYCSCDDYHFRVLGESIHECYHLIALRKAKEEKKFSKVVFSDEEYPGFVRGLVQDIFSHIS